VLLGIALRRIGVVTQSHINLVSRLAFTVGLPILLFSSASQVDCGGLLEANYRLAGVLATLATLIASGLYARYRRFARSLAPGSQ